MGICEICRLKQATRRETVLEGGVSRELLFCDDCFARAVSLGISPFELARRRERERRSAECPECGCTAETFARDYLFGCPDCYQNMAAVAEEELERIDGEKPKIAASVAPISNVDRALATDYVVSSRVRLARNILGLPFPRRMEELARRDELTDGEKDNLRLLLRGAMLASEGVFSGTLYEMSELSDVKKNLLVKSHMISPPLADSDLGAVIIERGEAPEISIMLCEEDHIRAQCVRQGLDIAGAYSRLARYDEGLTRCLPIAASARYGYLTACPTNVGTGMRASAMMFLPALRGLGRSRSVFDRLAKKFGITVRGYYGEGSEAAYDMYQVSNSRMLSVSEDETVRVVERAAAELCEEEAAATSELVDVGQFKLMDRLIESYNRVMSARELSESDMCELLADVRLGVRLGMFALDASSIDRAIDEGLTAFTVIDDSSELMRSYIRAQIVRDALGAK